MSSIENATVAKQRYRVILNPEEDGGYSVVIPAFPRGHTQGETVEECLAQACEVIELEIANFRDKGLSIPASDSPTAQIAYVSVSVPTA